MNRIEEAEWLKRIQHPGAALEQLTKIHRGDLKQKGGELPGCPSGIQELGVFSVLNNPVDPVILSIKSSSWGFTLLEVMVSMVLIATALVAVLHLQSQNLELQSEARFMTTARLLAQERIAWIAGNPEGFREGRDEGGFGEDHPEFRYMQEISRTGSTGSLYRVTLEVFDDETKRSERSFSVETFMYREKR